MSDAELIARLRGRSQFCKDRGEVKTPDLLTEAADRIEELLAERKKAVDAFVDLASATLAEIKGESHE